ncbi:non-ribosomal peptide synthetase [Williamsia sterculiae]|uniref:Amino acid adenylation domain-containing protein n=1 Tax=Williamsia sterculiae TaxID=1344003 RepID=A0A1N7CF53_9NOCA|nr:non-ribosomal peptide synthetase [Williamsia sterculiae]SIR62236.1 amino acid adenylation domain-containing protein [Williamsia sterculiae]
MESRAVHHQATGRPGTLALTSAQREVWAATRINPDDPAFSIGWTVDFLDVSAADVDRLCAAIDTVVRAAETLHVVIESDGGEVYQRMVDPPEQVVSRVRCDDDTARREIEADLDVVRSLDGILFTQRIFEFGDGRVRWYQGYHHIVTDAYAVRALTRAVATVYDGGPVPTWSLRALVDDDVEYQSSAQAVRDREMMDVVYDRIDEMSRLADRTRESAERHRGADTDGSDIICAGFALDDPTGVLTEHPRTLAAALAVYVHRAGAYATPSLSMAVHNRTGTVPRRELGMMSRSHPLAVGVAPTDRLTDVRTALDPALDLLREHGRAVHRPMPGVSANLMFWPTPILFGGQQVRLRGVRLGPVHDVDVAVEHEPGLGTLVDVRGPAGTAELHRDRLRRFLAQVGPSTRAHTPDILGDTEYDRIVRDFNDSAEPTVERTVPEMFAEAVADNPDAVALVDGVRSLTYTELDVRVRQLAVALLTRGLRPERTVGIGIGRSMEAVVAALAVMTAGGAFVPLDPAWPTSRRRDVAQTSAMTHQLVGSVGDVDTLELDGVDTLVADLDDWDHDDGTAELSAVSIRGDSLAYVMFTSGSTGKPKGAMIRHEAICARIAWQIDTVLDFGTTDAALFKAPLSFDISVNEFLLPLLSGGRVVIAAPGEERDPHRLLDLIEQQQVTFVYLVSSMLDVLLDIDDGSGHLGGLRHVWCGGEVLTPSLFDRFRRQLSTTLYHGYGPAEATIGVSHVIYRDTAERIATSIGRPNPNTELYVLDDNLRPLPVGVRGELYAAGYLLGRGYVGAPGLTASRFIANPFGAPGTRLYRTGDRAAWTADGTLEFGGRTDNQVKIRGMRLELDEVEAVIADHPAVRHCAVTVRRNTAGVDHLAAYVIPTAGARLDAADLRGWAHDRLPDYMVPAGVGIVDTFPLTANGKLDRRALPEPDALNLGTHRDPSTPHENAVCAVMADILGAERVGAEDDFFDHGGDSILGIRLAESLSRRFGRRVPVGVVFTHRTPTELAAWSERHGVLSTELMVAEDPAGPVTPVDPDPLDGDPEPSDAQRRMLLLHRLAPESPTYTVPLVWHFGPEHGPDPRTLELALHDICARQDILRTVYPDLHHPMVVPSDDVPALLTVCTAPPAPESIVFDLRTDIPVHAWWCADKGTLTIAFAHVAVDDHSEGVFRAELAEAYAARQHGQPAPREPLRISYAAHTRRSRARLGRIDDDGSPAARSAAYWRGALAEAPAAPIGDPSRIGTAGATIDVTVPDDLAHALYRTVRGTSTSMFMLTHAATALAVSAMTGADDIVVAAPVSLRTHADLDAVMGCLLNTLMLRTTLGGDPTVSELLSRIGSADLDAYDHRDLAYEDVLDVVGLTAAQLPQVMAIYLPHGVGDGDLRLGAGVGARAEATTGTAKFPLTFTLIDSGESIRGTVEYATGVLDADMAHRYVDCFVAALHTLSGDPEARESRWSLTGPGERDTVDDFARGPHRPEPEVTLTDLVTAGLRIDPSTTAVRVDGVGYSAGRLDADADTLADALTRHGVGVESVVGVYVPRSYELIVSLVAIHRAGAAYLPLDASSPDDRLRYVVDDARPQVVLATGRTPFDDVTIIDPTVPAGSRDHRPAGVHDPVERATATGDNAAYVIYTSGSTGRPKGTVVSHRSAANRLLWMRDRYRVAPDDRIVQKTPAGFDVSVWEFFLPLLTGACLVVAEPEAHTDPDRIRDLIDTEGATIVHFVPSMLDAYLTAVAHTTDHPTLRLIACSGEALGAGTAMRTLTGFPAAELVNLYGPTEAAVDVTAYRVTEQTTSPVPIGAPIDNTTAHVLDHALRPVPIGAPGDLYLGGIQLARGYPGSPALTATRFVADPLSDGGARLYRTGDRACWDSRGDLVYLGRDDDQVKINGQRVELGEITEALIGLDGVDTAAVIARDGVLIGYVVGTPPNGHPDWTDTLRDHLAVTLPRHMVPTHLIHLTALPTTANGKLDRRSLPAPTVTDDDEPAREGTETVIAEIFRDVLGAATVGRDRSIIEMGAHSLTAIRILTRLRQQFDVRIPLGHFITDPTIAAAARHIDAVTADEGATPVHTDEQPSTRGQLSSGQLRMWADSVTRGPDPTYNIPLVWRHSLGTDSDDVTDVLDRALRDVVERHEILRTIYPAVEGRPTTRVIDTPEQIVETSAETAEHLVRIPFRLDRDLPVRGFVTDTHVVVVIHHIAFDEWSRSIFEADLRTAFAARSSGDTPTWPAPAPQFAEVAPIDDEDPAAIEAACRAVAGLPESTDLPVDRSRPDGFAAPRPGGVIDGVLDRSATAALRRVAAGAEATMAMTTATLAAAAVHAVGAGDDLALGAPVSLRDRPGSDSAIGYFLNSLVLRVGLDGHPTFDTLLSRMRSATIGAFDLAHVPFDRIVAATAADRAPGASPLFDVMVVHQNAADDTATSVFGDSRIVPETITTATAKFDLLVEFTENPDTGTIGISVEYGADVFDRDTVAGLVDRLVRIAGQVGGAPTTSLAELDTLDADETDRLREWNDTAVPTDSATLVDLLDAQVRATPDACAVRDGESSLTFAELAARSTALAGRLCGLGAVPDRVVGVCLSRSVDLLVALMGVVRSGAAYLPLDPDYPAERLRFTADDARPVAVVAQRDMVGFLPADVPVIDAVSTTHSPVATIAPSPDDLAYVIYTSGSTGRPKGVGNTHRALVSHLRWMQREYTLDADDVVLQKTPAGFDVSVWEFFLAATVGACTVMAEPGGQRDPGYLHRTIRENRVTTIHFVPPMLEALLAATDLSECGSLRRIICSGEALPADVARATRRALPGVRLDNLYGPTEAAIDVTRHTVGTDPGAIVPIGGPVDNTGLRVLDRELRDVPVGVAGELYLTGTQLARGYHRRPGLTAARFVADPRSTSGGRMYRTGDVARWNRRGEVEYLGRSDDQVKIRGQRIELGEISASIVAACPAVDQAVAVVRDGRIIAYTVGSAASDEVLASIGGRLPEHMLPSVVVPLTSLPLSPNGKLDRRALPQPAPVQPSESRPATEAERRLLEVLDRELGLTMGPTDDFFRHGGDSISAVLWAAKSASAGFSFGIRDVFEQRTPAALAERFAPTPRRRTDATDSTDTPVAVPPPVQAARKSRTPEQTFRAQVAADGVADTVDLESVETALREQHEGLRLAVDTRRRTLWRARLVPPPIPAAEPLDWAAGRGYSIDLTTTDGGDRVIEVAVHSHIGDQHAADDLARAALALIRGADRSSVALHHMPTSEGAEQHA